MLMVELHDLDSPTDRRRRPGATVTILDPSDIIRASFVTDEMTAMGLAARFTHHLDIVDVRRDSARDRGVEPELECGC